MNEEQEDNHIAEAIKLGCSAALAVILSILLIIRRLERGKLTGFHAMGIIGVLAAALLWYLAYRHWKKVFPKRKGK